MKRACLAILAVLLFAQPGEPTAVKKLDDSGLVSNATTIFHGDCLKVEPEWDRSGKRIYTRVTFAPREVLKGTNQATVELLLPGGRMDGKAYVLHGIPTFTRGEEAVVYASARHKRSGICVPVGLGQGVFRVKRSAKGRVAPRATRDTRDLLVVDMKKRSAKKGKRETRDLGTLLRDVRSEVTRQRRAKKGKRK